jgi:hypothetical protein
MGFLKDIRNLQEQADAMAPPAPKAPDLAAGGRSGAATIPVVRDTGVATDGDASAGLDPSAPRAGGPA